jgi:hypothetical protein
MIETQSDQPDSRKGDAQKVVNALEELVRLVQASGNYVRYAPEMPDDAVMNLGVRFSPVVRDSEISFFFIVAHLCEATVAGGKAGDVEEAPDSQLGETGSKVLFSATAEFLLQYRLKPNSQVSKDDLEMFAKKNGVFNVQPFWREFLLSSSLRAQLPGVVAPILKLEDGSMPPTRTRILNS